MQVIPYEEPSIQIDGPEPRGVLVVPVTLGGIVKKSVVV